MNRHIDHNIPHISYSYYLCLSHDESKWLFKVYHIYFYLESNNAESKRFIRFMKRINVCGYKKLGFGRYIYKDALTYNMNIEASSCDIHLVSGKFLVGEMGVFK